MRPLGDCGESVCLPTRGHDREDSAETRLESGKAQKIRSHGPTYSARVVNLIRTWQSFVKTIRMFCLSTEWASLHALAGSEILIWQKDTLCSMKGDYDGTICDHLIWVQ